jgi:hypothetical protein
MPFDLPKHFKVFSQIGALPSGKWTLKQNLAAEYKIKDQADLNVTDVFQKKMSVTENRIFFGDETESFVLGELPNWGEYKIPREIYLEHAIPIFLRESQKINEGKLPEALLNCWWLEMIILLSRRNIGMACSRYISRGILISPQFGNSPSTKDSVSSPKKILFSVTDIFF